MSSNYHNQVIPKPTGDPYRLIEKQDKGLVVICPKCKNVANKYLPEGYDSSTGVYYRCSNVQCLLVAEYWKFNNNSNSVPLGSSDPNYLRKESKMNVVQRRRTVPKPRHILNRGRDAQLQDIPKLGNKPDIFLENLVNQGAVITALVDDPVNDSEEIENPDRYQ